MKLEDILEHWKVDAQVDYTKAGLESINTAKLHHKYTKMLSNERLRYQKAKSELNKMLMLKHEYYTGSIDEETLEEYNWEPFQKMVLKQDLNTYIEADDDIIQARLKLSYIHEKVEILESIIKTLNNRGFHIKNYIDFEKFMNGYG